MPHYAQTITYRAEEVREIIRNDARRRWGVGHDTSLALTIDSDGVARASMEYKPEEKEERQWPR